MGPVWRSVTITGREYETNPNLQCNDCGKCFSGGVTRIKQHITDKCTCSTPELQALKRKLLAEKVVSVEATVQRAAEAEVDAAAEKKFKPEQKPTHVAIFILTVYMYIHILTVYLC